MPKKKSVASDDGARPESLAEEVERVLGRPSLLHVGAISEYSRKRLDARPEEAIIHWVKAWSNLRASFKEAQATLAKRPGGVVGMPDRATAFELLRRLDYEAESGIWNADLPEKARSVDPPHHIRVWEHFVLDGVTENLQELGRIGRRLSLYEREGAGQDAMLTPSNDTNVCLGPGGAWLKAEDGTRYDFSSPRQREVIAALYKCWETGGEGAGMTEHALPVEIERPATKTRPDKLFKGHPALGTVLRRVAPATWALVLSSAKGPQKDR